MIRQPIDKDTLEREMKGLNGYGKETHKNTLNEK